MRCGAAEGTHTTWRSSCPTLTPKLTEKGRLTLCRRIAAGQPPAHVAEAMGVFRPTAYRWWNRYRELGAAGLVDRPSRPRRSPSKTRRDVERKVCNLRRRSKLGPARIGTRLGVPPSTVHRVLVRHGLNRLDRLDRPTGEPIRRYQRDRPGELVHVDIKKLGKIPDGGGWRAHGRGSEAHRASHRRAARGGRVRIGYDYVHSAVDDHSRLAYSEILPMRPPPRRWRSGAGRRTSSPHTGSRSSGC